MSESVWTKKRRAAVSLESSWGTSDGSWKQLGEIEEVNWDPRQEAIPDDRHVLASMSNYAPFLGPKQGTLTFRLPWHDKLVDQAGPLLKAALGAVSGNSLTYNDSGSDSGTIVKSGGTHDPIVIVTSGGVIYARPIYTVSTNDGELAILLPGDPTAATNADATNGACYIADPTVITAVTVAMEIDRCGDNDSLPYTMNKGIVTGMVIELDLAGRMSFVFTVEFFSYLQTTASNISNPTDPSGHFLGMAGEAFFADYSSPAAGTQLDVGAFSVNFVREQFPRNAMQAPAGTVPQNPAVGVYSGRMAVSGVQITYTKIAQSHITAWESRTARWGFFSWAMGRPGASTTKDLVTFSFPRLIPSQRPVETEIENLVGMACAYTSEVERSLTAPYGYAALAISSAA